MKEKRTHTYIYICKSYDHFEVTYDDIIECHLNRNKNKGKQKLKLVNTYA